MSSSSMATFFTDPIRTNRRRQDVRLLATTVTQEVLSLGIWGILGMGCKMVSRPTSIISSRGAIAISPLQSLYLAHRVLQLRNESLGSWMLAWRCRWSKEREWEWGSARLRNKARHHRNPTMGVVVVAPQPVACYPLQSSFLYKHVPPNIHIVILTKTRKIIR